MWPLHPALPRDRLIDCYCSEVVSLQPTARRVGDWHWWLRIVMKRNCIDIEIKDANAYKFQLDILITILLHQIRYAANSRVGQRLGPCAFCWWAGVWWSVDLSYWAFFACRAINGPIEGFICLNSRTSEWMFIKFGMCVMPLQDTSDSCFSVSSNL